MGASFTNYHVRKADAAHCAKVLPTLISSRAVVTDSKNGWITIYDEQSESQDVNILHRFAKALSSKLKAPLVAMMVHDSDIFVYLSYEKGELIDQFDSKPDYFGPVSEAKKEEWRGDFSKLLRFASKKTSIQDLKRVAAKEFVFEEERAGEFAELLGVDPSRARTGFKYVQETNHQFKLIQAKGYSQDQALLVEAVSRGDETRVKELLEKGISTHGKDKFGQPLLVLAGRRGKVGMVRDLMVHGADPFEQVSGGGDALWIAAAEGHEQIVAHLLEKAKGNPKLPSSLRTAFGAAVMAGHTKVMKDLILAGADVNEKTPLGQLPLMLASMRGLEFIWTAKMNLPFPPRPGQPRTDWKEVVMILLNAGAQIPFPMKDGPIDVKSLSANQKSKLADALLEAGKKIKLPENSSGLGQEQDARAPKTRDQMKNPED
ncbi:MAG TPA: ankyrin repeat domain-containing protein [Candidatus Acidoferrum sp.]|nr:ankyrin repeat domain-containing protein [Candidatus Acidoferrum sp.]